ncbi:type II toxin-antitoxin system MqsR family toxin [Convivina intestini]|uniref:type II toxin-antitoxin system MqsR family toxin n=1 Tax=Convivina intestini TaxID=1505726 RepID=UPI0020107CC4|nr:type II toxin-antitoxin system MqsR family toxin [Convivina intestini]CAH1851851.1 hypothetical protein R078131_00357 [Convivina intestini]
MDIFHQAQPAQIKSFLRKFKAKVRQQEYTLSPRAKNLEFLRRQGISIQAMEKIILALTANAYDKGPDPDRKHSSEWIWVFKTKIDGCNLYIKLQLRDDFGFIISFHD